MPVPQVAIHDEHFRFVGRVDGLWPDDLTFAEADGHGKYFLGLDASTPAAPSSTQSGPTRRRVATSWSGPDSRSRSGESSAARSRSSSPIAPISLRVRSSISAERAAMSKASALASRSSNSSSQRTPVSETDALVSRSRSAAAVRSTPGCDPRG